ncbi:hypothetical protein BDQ17DRAFT_1357251 [Cyathus striatus]|nr:hypothetical protein BDQ17DRAFT_1357251 [Cyathus striatus]
MFRIGGLINFKILQFFTLPATCTRNYTVVAHNFCDLISAKEGVSSFQLASVNAGIINADCTNLFVGEVKFTLPTFVNRPVLGSRMTRLHQVLVVQPTGDSYFSIATDTGISVDTLVANNPNVNADCTNIHPGEVLCVSPAANTASS